MTEHLPDVDMVDFSEEAQALVDFLESDFGCSGPPVRFEAIKCELEAAYKKGRAVTPPARWQNGA